MNNGTTIFDMQYMLRIKQMLLKHATSRTVTCKRDVL